MGAKERFLKLSIFLLFVLAMGYCGLWFYRADVTKRLLGPELRQQGDFGFGKFTFEKLSVTGFPFSFIIEIEGIKLTVNKDFAISQGSVSATQISIPKLFAHSNVTGSSYVLEPIGDILLENSRKKHASLSLTSPQLKLNLPKETLVNALSSTIRLSEICSFHYQDKGFNVVSSSKDESILTGNGTTIASQCTLGRTSHTSDLTLAISLQRGKGFQDFTGLPLATQQMDITAKTSAVTTKSKGIASQIIDLKINELTLKLDNATLSLEGSFKGPALLFYNPNTDVNLLLKATNYPELFDSALKNSWIDEHAKQAITKLLPEIATSVDDKDFSLAFLHTQGSSVLQLGKLGYPDAIKKFNAYMKPEHTDNP